MATPKLGIYRHYKDLLVRVIGVAKHSESLEELVIYEKMGSLWARPLTMFTENVTINGQSIPRFEYLGDRVGEGQ